MRFNEYTAATLHLLGSLNVVERPTSWPILQSPANDTMYFGTGNFSIRDSWILYAQESGPDAEDVVQRELGECWLAASLKALAGRQKSAITDNLVRLNDTQFVFRTIVPLNDTVFVPIDVAVDASVPAIEYKKSLEVRMSPQHEAIVWPTLIEKAMAKILIEYCIQFELDCQGGNVSRERTLNVLHGNLPATILTMMTKKQYVWISPDDLSDDDILDIGKMAEDRPVVITTKHVNVCSMKGNHALWLAGLDAEGRLIVHETGQKTIVPYSITDFRRQVSTFTVPATYMTRKGKYPRLGASMQGDGWLCDGFWLIQTLILTLSAIFIFTYLLGRYKVSGPMDRREKLCPEDSDCHSMPKCHS